MIKPINEFYSRSNRIDKSGYCKICSNKYHTNRIKEIKIKMISYKGGKCCDCKLGLNELHYAVFDFHHIVPKSKDINFNRIKYQNWRKIKEELDKCILLCSNCHRTRHAIIANW